MKINSSFIKKIFNNEIKLKNKEDKIKLSNFNDIIPMFDIYSQKIYPINKENVYYRLIDCHYRFINDEIKDWIKNKLNKAKDELLKNIFKLNLEIISNYDLSTLEKTSYETFYKYSPELGLNVSICKRNSFHKYIDFLNPYYTKLELIKLGKNMGVINNVDQKKILNKELHYKICKKISNNDISREEIKKFNQYLIKEKCLNWICFYSFTGSYLLNNFLRDSDGIINKHLYEGLNKINNVIKNAPKLDKDYYFYRFISDDDFLKDIKIGQTFVDSGFLSTTRDPFYNPGIDQKFGLILVKIHVPKAINGVGIFIENFSLFPKEEEFILPPYTKLKLLSKDDKFKYYHINSDFEENIKIKYEFEVKSFDYNKIKKINYTDIDIPQIDINDNYEAEDNFSTIKRFTLNTNILYDFKININKTEYIFDYQWFDSTDTYSKYYYNNIKDGIIFTHYENGYPLITIECGEKMVINYLNKYFIYDSKSTIYLDSLIEIVVIFAKLFLYKSVIIFTEYKKFAELETYSKEEEYSDLLHTKLYNEYLYEYCLNIKNKKKNNKLNKYIEYKYGIWKLNKILNEKIPKELSDKLPEELKNVKFYNLIIEIIEKYFYLYNKLESWLNKYASNLIIDNYFIFDTEYYLKENNINYSIPLHIEYNKEKELSENFKIIFRNNLRRIV
jgi:hypothetical protein